MYSVCLPHLYMHTLVVYSCRLRCQLYDFCTLLSYLEMRYLSARQSPGQPTQQITTGGDGGARGPLAPAPWTPWTNHNEASGTQGQGPKGCRCDTPRPRPAPLSVLAKHTSMCSKLQVHQSLNCKRNPAPRGVHGKGKWSPGGWLAGLGGVHTCPSASGAREVLNPRTVCLKAGTMRRN